MLENPFGRVDVSGGKILPEGREVRDEVMLADGLGEAEVVDQF